MAAGKVVAETVATELDQVADDIAHVAATTRKLDGRLVSSVGVSVGIGVGLGIYFGYRYAKRKLRNEIYAEAEKDIEMIRDHYQKKLVALERDERPAVEDLVKERGYVSEDETDVKSQLGLRPLPAPVPVDDAEPVKLPDEIAPAPIASSRRHLTETPVEPYLISEPEFLHNESGYAQVNYTYYSDDDVLVDDDDPRSILSNREELIGRDAAHELANSSDSSDETYVRNPRLELEMIIHHVQRSWDEEVLGLDPNESG